MKQKKLFPLAVVVLMLALAFNYYSQGKALEERADYYEHLIDFGQSTEEIAGNAAKITDKSGTLVGYAGIEEYNGFGGPMLVALLTDANGIITKIEILEHRETPQYLERIEKAGFYDQYTDRDITSGGMTFGVDIDGLSGATLSTRAIAMSVDGVAESIRVAGMGLPPSTASIPWQVGAAEIGVAVIIVGAIMMIRVPAVRKYRLVFLIISMLGIGFWLNRPVSMAQISGVFMGYFPAFKTNLIWYMLVLIALVPPLVFGKNYYCTFICPFGAAQEVIHTATKKAHLPLKGKHDFLRQTRNLVLFAALLVAFLFQNPSVSNFEPFAALFSFEASGIQWLLLFGVIGSAIFFRKIWCSGFCPVGALLDLIAKLRNQLVNKKKGLAVVPPVVKPEANKAGCGGCEPQMTKKEKLGDDLFKFFYFITIFSVVVAIFEKWSQL